MKKLIFIIPAVLVLIGCGEETEITQETPMTMGVNSGTIHFTATTPCQAGDYSEYPTGIKNITIECDHDGKLSKITRFYAGYTFNQKSANYKKPAKHSETEYYSNGFLKKYTIFTSDEKESTKATFREDGTRIKYTFYSLGTIYYKFTYHENSKIKTRTWYHQGTTNKSSESTHYKNGNTKTSISYQTNGTDKISETTYYESKKKKTEIDYDSDGVIESGYPKCYEDTNDNDIETCTQDKHGCTSSSNTCISE